MIILGWVGVFFICQIILLFLFFTLFFFFSFFLVVHIVILLHFAHSEAYSLHKHSWVFCPCPRPPSFFSQEIFHPCPPLLYVSPCKYFTPTPIFSYKYSPQHLYFPNCKQSTQVNLQPNPFSAFTYLFLVQSFTSSLLKLCVCARTGHILELLHCGTPLLRQP